MLLINYLVQTNLMNNIKVLRNYDHDEATI